MDEVLALWAKRGWQPDLPATLGLRALSTMDWFRRNIVLLKHTGETDTTAAAKALRRIGQFDFVWQSQAPGQRAAAFQEDAPAFPKGYGRIAAFQAG